MQKRCCLYGVSWHRIGIEI